MSLACKFQVDDECPNQFDPSWCTQCNGKAEAEQAEEKRRATTITNRFYASWSGDCAWPGCAGAIKEGDKIARTEAETYVCGRHL